MLFLCLRSGESRDEAFRAGFATVGSQAGCILPVPPDKKLKLDRNLLSIVRGNDRKVAEFLPDHSVNSQQHCAIKLTGNAALFPLVLP